MKRKPSSCITYLVLAVVVSAVASCGGGSASHEEFGTSTTSYPSTTTTTTHSTTTTTGQPTTTTTGPTTTTTLPSDVPPIANAGPDKNVTTGSLVVLDGSGSYDPDGDTLRYEWSLVQKPFGSTASLSNGTTVRPTFTPDIGGTYVIQLTVNDGRGNGASDTAIVVATARNRPPVANAGPNQNVITATLVTLDGSRSYDPDGDALTYNWSFTYRPSGSTTILFNHTTAHPTFRPDIVGTYVIQIAVEDGQQDSGAATVTIRAFPPPTLTTWNKTFGGAIDSVQQTTDGGYIGTGCLGSPSRDFWLIKIDPAGNKQWDKTFGGNNDDVALSVQQSTDGGYILAGYTSSYGAGNTDFWLVKTDTNGNKQWDKTFGGSSFDVAHSVSQTGDGGYIVGGYTWSFGAGSGDFWLIKTDANGNKQWDKTFGGPAEEQAYSVAQTMDGGYIVAGYGYFVGCTDAWLVKTDANGNEQWSKNIGGSMDDRANYIQPTTDGGYIVSGTTWSYSRYPGAEGAWLLKTDAYGNKEWDNTFFIFFHNPDMPYPVDAYSAVQTTDGGYIVGCDTSSPHGPRGWLIKTDGYGNEQWDEIFDNNMAHSVQQTVDGGYIVAGGTLIKTDANGNAPPAP